MDLTKKTILIVEDELPMLSILTDKLTAAGLTALQAKNGEGGLQLALQHHPDLILMDLLMPKMDGMNMLKNLRQDAWGKSVPVIILTNVNPDSDTTLQAIVENQPAYYLVKSDIKLDDILQKIKSVLTDGDGQAI